ncbi:hypothetical protein HGRIS_007951 [Hohenbuehelia grisea]|uniref:Uncharacterized protein n=1 Tax=Hohenbuehelia grisea TaxID=104357 RepID=A0ABR3J6E8_9AGAR
MSDEQKVDDKPAIPPPESPKDLAEPKQLTSDKPSDPSPHVVLDIQDAPPEFSHYQPEISENDDGDIISHDHHLNQDGEALYRFLLAHAARRPSFTVYIGGTHTEHRSRTVSRTVNGRHETHVEHYTETVTDFGFHIDLSKNIVTGPVHWSYADAEPAYRGLMVRQVQTPTTRRKATSEEITAHKNREYERTNKGLPPWASPGTQSAPQLLQSSTTVRQWADEYCSSPKILKEFAYEKFIHGWDLQALEAAIRESIAETQYRGSVEVQFITGATKITVRADNRLSRLLSRRRYVFLLCIVLVYPFIWLFKRYSSRGGGRWEVCGGAYALKHMVPLDDDNNSFPLPEPLPGQPPPEPRAIETATGEIVKLVGQREGEWFRQWEHTIKRAVVTGMTTTELFQDVRDAPVDRAAALDGY